MESRKRALVLVNQTNYADVVGEGVAVIHALSKKHGLGPKMETQLLTDITRGIEMLSKEARETYIRDRLIKPTPRRMPVESTTGKPKERSGIITRYVELGMHELACMSEAGFRQALAPLVEKTISYFSPPTKHPIVDGEFTCLPVIPLEWVPLRGQLALLRKTYGLSPDFPKEFDEELRKAIDTREIAPHGRTAPKEPYTLVGIDAGRGLKGVSRGIADTEVGNLGLSYLLPHEYIQLLLVRPEFLLPGEEGTALGEKFSSKYLRVTVRGGRLDEGGVPELSFVSETANGSSFKGLGKPTYTKIITL